MKNLFKKALSLMLGLSLACAGSVATFAADEDDNGGMNSNTDDSTSSSDAGLYVRSPMVPEATTAFAREKFSQLNQFDMEALQFSATEATNMRLAPGFVIEPIDNGTPSYYFMILTGDQPIGSILVFQDEDGDYIAQIGQDPMATKMYSLYSSLDSPVTFVASSNASYAILSDGNVEVVEYSPNFSQESIDSETNQLSGDTLARNSSSDNIVTVNADTVYTETINDTMPPQSRKQWQRKDTVDIVPNQVYDGKDNVKRGTCWASVTGSILGYQKTSKSGKAWRNWVLNQQEIYNSNKNVDKYNGGISDAIRYINQQTGEKSTAASGKPSVDDLIAHIQGSKPFYARYSASSSSVGHALTVFGYIYDDQHEGDANYVDIYVMDPNKTAYAKVSPYKASYKVNSTNMTMEKWQKYPNPWKPVN